MGFTTDFVMGVWGHGLGTPREEIVFTARPKIQSQLKVINTKYSKQFI